MKRNVAIIIPVFNEEKTIRTVVEKILALEFVVELIVVNDGSTDRTGKILQTMHDNRLRLIDCRKNAGKTSAIRRALPHLTADIVVIQDADLEYSPDELVFLCEPIWEDRADVVYGSRFLVRRASRVLYFYHYLGNKSLTFLTNFFTNKNMTDIETCYKAMRRPLLQEMPITSRRFGMEVEITIKLSRTRARIYEVPISYYGRTYEEGKKISYRDGIAAFWYVLKYGSRKGRTVGDYVSEMDRWLEIRRNHRQEADERDD